MTTIASTRPRCSTSILVWIVATIILALYFSGLVAFDVISHGDGPEVSIGTVMQRVIGAQFFKHVSPLHLALVVAVAVSAMVLYSFSPSLRIRLAVPVFCIVASLCFGFPATGIAVPLAPFYTVGALAGLLDGEFYAEGWLSFIAVGWWIILWCVLLLRELKIWVHEPFAA